MSGYQSNRAPNVSQYLANLNHVAPLPSDVASTTAPADDINFDGTLEFLTNTDFFDFDQFHPPAFDPVPPAVGVSDPSAQRPRVTSSYGYTDFTSFPGNNTALASPASSATSPTNIHGAYPGRPFAASPQPGDKRSATTAQMPVTADLEETSRLAAEEDKRRRNTAASARFRVKKKQREQALEKQSKEMLDKVAQLEGKVQQLEMENKWLKELITEKSDVKTLDAALALKSEKNPESRSTDNRTDGVGTAAAAAAAVTEAESS